jgi:lysophospholipase L1-like esterase
MTSDRVFASVGSFVTLNLWLSRREELMRIWPSAKALYLFLLAIPALSQSSSTKGLYVALGDSITAGTGVVNNCKPFPTQPVDIEEYCPDGTSYPILVAKALRSAGTAAHFLNLGIPGATVERILADELPNLPADTSLVTIYIGTNDSRQFGPITESVGDIVGRYEQLYEKMLGAVREKAPRARVVLINIPNEEKVGVTYHLTDVQRERFGAISQAMDRFIDKHYPDYAVVDTICDSRSYIIANRDKGSVHPNEAGAADLAGMVIKVLLAKEPIPPPSQCTWFNSPAASNRP